MAWLKGKKNYIMGGCLIAAGIVLRIQGDAVMGDKLIGAGAIQIGVKYNILGLIDKFVG